MSQTDKVTGLNRGFLHTGQTKMELRSSTYPVLVTFVTQLAALAFVYELMPLQGAVTFQPYSGGGAPVLNALIFLSLPIAGTLAFLKLRRRTAIKQFYAVAESLLVVLLTYIILALTGIPDPLPEAFGVVIGIVGYLTVMRGKDISKAAYAVLISSEAGSFLAVMFTPPTVYLVFLFFALYDVFAVFRGPLKKVIDEPGFGMLSFDVGHISIGLGDQVFYSMAPATGYIIKGVIGALGVLVLVDVGFFLTLALLSRRRALPGLTIPLLLTVFFLILFP
ncbi:MAG: hypothetical protein JRN68_03045 [Nitrososphaerota archaeon]|nr:hypothetical protein [Nitrososphaerota archaeon]